MQNMTSLLQHQYFFMKKSKQGNYPAGIESPRFPGNKLASKPTLATLLLLKLGRF